MLIDYLTMHRIEINLHSHPLLGIGTRIEMSEFSFKDIKDQTEMLTVSSYEIILLIG